MEIEYDGPDMGLDLVLWNLSKKGETEDSRNGPVLRFTEPVMLKNVNPTNRVSFYAARDANPFFHFMESIWMLAGMNEVAPIAVYNKGMAKYSDDGHKLRGTAYGFKWRTHFGYDQIEMAVQRLRDNPSDRRVVITMWDPYGEWKNPISKDLSCNLQIIVGTRLVKGERVLDMEVTNRSNDIIYGCLGSNVFHFSFLLEYLAYRTGYSVGRYYQVAFNLHGYVDNPIFKACYDQVTNGVVTPQPPSTLQYIREMGIESTPAELGHFMLTGDPGNDLYLKSVGQPLFEAYRVFSIGRRMKVDPTAKLEFAKVLATECADAHLATASVAWLDRRLKKLEGNND